MREEIRAFLQKTHYKNIFIIGVYIATFFIALFSIVFNFIIQNYANLKISIFYFILLLISLYQFKKEQDIYKTAITLFWISTFIEVLFLLLHKADINLIYIILLPIIIYMILPFRKLMVHLFLFYLLVFAILYYEVSLHSESFLHNSKYLFNFLIANIVILFNGLLYNLVINRFIEHLEKSNKEKNILLKELHHRVKNNLNLISSILGLNARKIKNKEAKELLLANEHRIKSMAIVHEILYKDGNFDTMSLKTYLKELTHYILEAEDEQKSKKIELSLQIKDIKVNSTTLLFFGILVNELLTNSIKHSFRVDGNYKIVISFLGLQDGYEFIYKDNTQKVDKESLNKGFGSDLINLVVMQLKGKVSLKYDKGLIYRIFFTKEVLKTWEE